MDHRVEPPSWLPEGAEPEPEGESPASGDSTVSAKAADDKSPHGNGQDKTGAYSYYSGSYGDGEDGAFGSDDGDAESPFGSGKPLFGDSAKSPFLDPDKTVKTPFSDPEKTVSVDAEKREFPGSGTGKSPFDTTDKNPFGGPGSAFGADSGSAFGGTGSTSFADSAFADSSFADTSLRDTSLREEQAPGRDADITGGKGPTGKGGRPSPDLTTVRYPAGAAQDAARAEAPADAAAAGSPGGASGSSTYSSYSTYGTAGSAAAGPATAYAGPARPKQSAAQPRRANLIVARLEPWSVMKFSFLISLVAWIVLFVAVAILYFALSGLGVFDAIQRTLTSVTSSQASAGVSLSKWTSASRVLGYTMLIGAVNVVLITALSTVGSMIYNLVTHLGGGIEVTLKETD